MSLTQAVPVLPSQQEFQQVNIAFWAKQITIRIVTSKVGGSPASGSGVMVMQRGQVYTVLTNWHVVGFSDRYTVLTPDGRSYSTLVEPPKQLGSNDLALVKFRSSQSYPVATIASETPAVGTLVYAAGFPMYQDRTLTPTFDRGIQAFRMTQGQISLLPTQSLALGYQLGYTNEVEIGMSGGPIFNNRGFLVGVNGRGKQRDPSFGVYGFEDGTEPSPQLLEQMINASWGIPITTYLKFMGNGSS